MYCKKCGAKMNDDAKFCPKCGIHIQSNEIPNEENKKIEDNEVILNLKPEFNMGYKVLTIICNSFLYCSGFILGLFVEFGSNKYDKEKEFMEELIFKFAGIAIAIFIIYLIIRLIIEKKQYEHYEYNFYKTKVEYIDGFLNKEKKELKYKFIREVLLKQNIFERMFHIGTIRIYTNASSTYTDRGRVRSTNGIEIHCIRTPEEQYKKVKEIIG